MPPCFQMQAGDTKKGDWSFAGESGTGKSELLDARLQLRTEGANGSPRLR